MPAPTTPATSANESANPGLWTNALSGGLVVNGVMRDVFADRDATLVGSPSIVTEAEGQALRLNDSGRFGQTIDAPHIDLSGLGAFSYWIYGRFTGTSSADEDTLGLQWSDLQGTVDADARRVLFRYGSDTQALKVNLSTSAGIFAFDAVNTGIGDAQPHVIGLNWDGSTAQIIVDGTIKAASPIGDPLASLTTLKHPEIMGGHAVTGSSSDSPRFIVYSWGLNSRAYTPSEITTVGADGFAPFQLGAGSVSATADMGSGSLARSAAPLTARAGVSQTIGAQTLSYAPANPTAEAGASAAMQAGALTLEALTAQLTAGQSLSIGAQRLTITPNAVTVTVGNSIAVSAGILAGHGDLTTYAPAVQSGHALTLDTGNTQLTGQEAIGQAGHAIAIGAGTFTITGARAYTQAGQRITAGTATLSLTGHVFNIALGTAGGYLTAGAITITPVFSSGKLSIKPN